MSAPPVNQTQRESRDGLIRDAHQKHRNSKIWLLFHSAALFYLFLKTYHIF